MLRAVEGGEVDVVITFSTNRLHRKIHLALAFVEGTIIERRRRCVFVAQNIDTEVAIPFAADWRWMQKREDSPWYSTMHLFRQASPGDWESAFASIERELSQLIQRS